MDGFQHLKGYFTPSDQKALLADVLSIIKAAPLYIPTMPKTGRPFSVKETNCGALGWFSDKAGYGYRATHPKTGKAWPPIPANFINLWQEVAPNAAAPEACLINLYHSKAKMGLHQDKDEQEFETPVVSLSLGSSAKFRLGGLTRRAPTTSLELASGDVVVLGGKARLAYHGIDRIIPNSSDLMEDYPEWQGYRINVTLRRVTETT